MKGRMETIGQACYRSCMLSRFLISAVFMMCMTHSDLERVWTDVRPSRTLSWRKPRLWARPVVAAIFIYKRAASFIDKLVFTNYTSLMVITNWKFIHTQLFGLQINSEPAKVISACFWVAKSQAYVTALRYLQITCIQLFDCSI